MHVVISYVLTLFIILIATLTIAREMIGAYGEITDALSVAQTRTEGIVDTRISASTGPTVNPGTTIDITLTNDGDAALGQFAEWDFILEIRSGSSITTAYMTYTTDANPAAGEWTVEGIYLDADTPTDEIVDPGIFNPGEEMIVRAEWSTELLGGTFHRATFVTPNGVITHVIFEVPATLYVLDETDATVYEYLANSTLMDSHALNIVNTVAKGITTDDTDFWTTDVSTDPDVVYKYDSDLVFDTTWVQTLLNISSTGITTDGTNIWITDSNALRVYKYDMNGNPDAGLPSFGLNLDNDDPTGVTTDGTDIWIVDDTDDTIYRYDLDGNFETSFALDAANTTPTGITSNGVSIWVVDGGGAVYRYNVNGALVSSFALDAANADPQGITVSPR